MLGKVADCRSVGHRITRRWTTHRHPCRRAQRSPLGRRSGYMYDVFFHDGSFGQALSVANGSNWPAPSSSLTAAHPPVTGLHLGEAGRRASHPRENRLFVMKRGWA